MCDIFNRKEARKVLANKHIAVIGGSNMRGTYNVPFSQVIPNFTTLTPTGTIVEPSMRTVSSTSISGSEGSFIDQGFEEISFNKDNHFKFKSSFVINLHLVVLLK